MTFSIGVRISVNGAPERRNPTKTKVVTLHRYNVVVRGLNGQDPTPKCGWLQPNQLLTSKVSGLRGRNSPFGRTRRNLVTTRARFLVSHIPIPYPNTSIKKFHRSTHFRYWSKVSTVKFDLFHRGQGFGERGSGASESHQNQGGDTS